MNKICTSIEQSKKLLELGIDVNTADMFWDTLFAKNPEAQVNNHHLVDEYDDEHRVPAWSLAALISLMPGTITSNDGIAFKLNIKKNIIEYSNPSLYLVYKSVKSDNLIDAAFEMMVWLKENKEI